MRLYLELYEKVPVDQQELNVGGFMRFPLKSVEDAKPLLDSLSSFYDLSRYDIKIHYCFHDEGKPCKLENYKYP